MLGRSWHDPLHVEVGVSYGSFHARIEWTHKAPLASEDTMSKNNLNTGWWAASAALAFACLLALQVAVATAAGPETYSMPQVIAQVPTPTPFRFVTPAPFSPGTTTTTTSPLPRAGGFPVELALPALAGGLAAIGGGSLLLRRKSTR